MQAIGQGTGIAISPGQASCLRGMARRKRDGISARRIVGCDRVHRILGCLPYKVPVQSNPRASLRLAASNLFSWMVHRYD